MHLLYQGAWMIALGLGTVLIHGHTFGRNFPKLFDACYGSSSPSIDDKQTGVHIVQ